MPTVRSVVLGLLATAIGTVRAADISEVITCYGHDGSSWANNTRCPGSDACCGVDATCLSNRLCHKPEDGPNTFIRGPCAVKPWNKGLCPQICEYNEAKTGKAARRFPRVSVCNDGSFCCDGDGIACCSQKKGVFLDKNGNIANGPATTTLSWGPERTSSGYQTIMTTHTAVTTASSASQATSSAPTSDSNDSNDNKAAKIGAGVGVPVGFLAIGGIAALFLMKRRKRARASTTAPEPTAEGGQKKDQYTPVPAHAPQELDGHESQIHRSELAA